MAGDEAIGKRETARTCPYFARVSDERIPMKHLTVVLPALAIAGGLALYASGIDVARLPVPDASVTYTDRTGAPLGTVLGAGSSRIVAVPLRDVSPVFVRAIVAAEDARFARHGAVDVLALLRVARDVAVFGEARSGGSTIEMQLARSISPQPPSGSAREAVAQKFEQIALAQRIAIVSSKADVLEAYVNRIPMGGNVYGVEAAARTYFGEPASDLDLAQASLLAAIPNDPARLAPGGDWSALRARQRYVLSRMVALGEISPEQADRAYRETLHARRHETGIAGAAHALFFLSAAGPAGGRVRTTLDGGLQHFVEAQTEQVIAALGRFHVTDGAALVVDNRTGNVLAYAGSPDYFSQERLGRNDGVQALRQAGSALKPFTYELALERGTIRSTTILSDAPAAYAIPGGRLYAPNDYSGRFSGPVRVRYALANSLNLPAVQVLSQLGVGALLERLHALGFSHLNRPASYYGLGLTLGSGEVSLWELVQAYSTMARGGDFAPLRLVERSAATTEQIGDPAYWSLVTDMLADPYARAKSFGIGSVLQMPFPAAVKTGTSSDFRDTWTVGFTREYTVGVWVGNFDGSPMRGVSGVTGAGPLWNRILLHLYERADDPPPFDPPLGFVKAPICATTGRAPEAHVPCPAVVREWIRSGTLAASPPVREVAGLRIVFPRDGDVFFRNAATSALQAREQQIALRAQGANGPVRWSVDGAPIQPDAQGIAFLPLRLGTLTILAADAARRARVSIRVLPAPGTSRPGFSFAKP